MSSLPIISFDTSAVNALADATDCSAVTAGLILAFRTRLTYPSVAEPLATKDSARRSKLFDTLAALLRNGECLEAHQFLISAYINNYEKYGNSNWNTMRIRFNECEDAIARRDLTEELSSSQRQSAADLNKRFAEHFSIPRPAFDRIFNNDASKPSNVQEFVTHPKTERHFWSVAASLYERKSGVRPSEEKVRKFAANCPPFFSVILGLAHGEFEWSLRTVPLRREKRVGSVDLLCSIYLPYCDFYLTDDEDQKRCLREIAETARLSVQILSFGDFIGRFISVGLVRTPSLGAQ